ncbi:MAG TPA: DNA polymerase III subunit beta, partial [Thermodesulfobacteriota bacterium]|nr:DNA polymerase III subunit beta [Thermodesulfobacteriota bacterium]
MKIQIDKPAFMEGLETVKGTVGKETHLPILRSVKITASEGNLLLHTTNLSTGTRASLKKVTVIEPGEALCDAAKLLSIVKNLPESTLTLATLENHFVNVACGKARFTLHGLRPDEFPQAITPPEENSFDISEEFFSTLSKVKNAASKDEIRFNLNGV